MTDVMRFLTAVYARLLRLYPPGFRAEFAEEMLAVFSAALEDARAAGAWPAVRCFLRELAALPASINQASRIERQHNTRSYRIHRLRFAARYNSLWFGGLLLVLGLSRFLRSGEMTPIRAFQLLLSLSLLLAWRWERTGGLIAMLGGALLCGLGMWGAYVSSQGETLPVQLLITLVGLLWGAPFLIFGGLFVRARTLAEA
jgi:hypothetical protein